MDLITVLCIHDQPPAQCIECATLVERTRVLTLFDEWLEQPGGLQTLRRAIETGTMMLGPEEDDR